MALPRRFYSVFLLSVFAVLGAFFYFSRNDFSISNSPFPLTELGTPFTTDSGEVVEPGVVDKPHGEDVADHKAQEESYKPPPEKQEEKPKEQPQEPKEDEHMDEHKHEQTHGQEEEYQKGRETRIALVESGGSHDEVTAAFVHAFGSQPDTTLDLYLARQRYGIKEIINNFTLASSKSIGAIKQIRDFSVDVRDLPPPHILISTTCELDLLFEAAPYEDLLAKGQTFLFCVVHHADRWGPGRGAGIATRIQPWVEKGLVDFITLSPHTAQHLRTASIDKWTYNDNGILVRAFPPVFPVSVPDPGKFDIGQGLSLAMQGDYSAERRNYTSVFERLESANKKVKDITEGKGTVDLHLIGHGNLPKVPDDVKKQTIFDKGLSYYDYYSLLSKQFAVLPAFASDDYFDRKASSSVPAALISGAPLVASQKLLDAYTYLPKEAVWVSEKGESEMDVIERLIDNLDAYVSKRDATRKACKDLIEGNKELVRKWISEGLTKVSNLAH